MAFMMYEQEQLLDPPDPAQHRQIVAELPDAAMQIHRWWLKHKEDQPAKAH
jgi:hypothetical protein